MPAWSVSAWGLWIEIISCSVKLPSGGSVSAWGLWIEIFHGPGPVSPLWASASAWGCGLKYAIGENGIWTHVSASAWGLWIEILTLPVGLLPWHVSFRVGAVDWNHNIFTKWEIMEDVSFREGTVDWNQLISECYLNYKASASARSLRIEILEIKISMRNSDRQLPQGSCGDRNPL